MSLLIDALKHSKWSRKKNGKEGGKDCRKKTAYFLTPIHQQPKALHEYTDRFKKLCSAGQP
ncbi:MAG TPA: hypothetical protein DCL66_13640 [Gammaproteobacteria bacterium]|nr:hypothetical protein [Gammaproteobacteria bacterium]